MRRLLIWIVAMIPSVATGNDCVSVIELSKTVDAVVHDQDSIEQSAEDFCSEYGRNRGSSGSSSFGASFEKLAGTFKSSKATVDQVASRYCSAESNYSRSKDAYKRYIESISGNAYSAYEQCMAYSKSDLSFSVDVDSILPRQFAMGVSFASSAADRKNAEIVFSTSDNVVCNWAGDSGKAFSLPTGSTAFLECTRDDASQESFVRVADRMIALKPMTLRWQAYSPDGAPIPTIEALQSAVENLERALEETENSLRVEFEKELDKLIYTIVEGKVSCPQGWVDRGRIGIIMPPDTYDAHNLGPGGAAVDGWRWTHPRLCRRGL